MTITEPISPGAPTPKPIPGHPRAYQFPAFQRHTLANGVRIVVAPVTKLPLVTVIALIEAGASTEPHGSHGLAALTARLLLEGAAGRDGTALAEQFERLGASVEARADWDTASITLTATSERIPLALGLVRDLLRAPAFPEREVNRLKEERLATLLQQLAEPRGLADEQFARAVYDGSARYASPEEGDADSVRRLTRDDVVAFHRARYQPEGTTFVFAGDISMEHATALTTSLFDDWPGNGEAITPTTLDTAASGPLVRIVAKADAPQSELRLGHIGLPRSTPDYFDTLVMNAVLGGLFSSRINLNLREVHGYTYGASSAFEWRMAAGPFVVETAIKSDVTGAAIREILSEIDRIRHEPIANDELTLATSYLDGVFPIRYETTAAIANALANLVIHKLPENYFNVYRSNVRAVTAESVWRAAKAHLHPDALRIVVVGDPAVVVPQLEGIPGGPPEVVNSAAELAE